MVDLSRGQKRGIIAILALINIIAIVDFMVMIPMAPFLIEGFGATTATYAYVLSAYSISAGLSGFLWLNIVNRVNYKWMLVILLTGLGVGTLLCGLAPNMGWLMVARTIAGGFAGTIGGFSYAILAFLFLPSERGRAAGFLAWGYPVAFMVGIPASLFLVNATDWRSPFHVLAFMCLPVLFVIVRYFPSMPVEKSWRTPYFTTLRMVFGRRANLLAMLTNITLILSTATVVPFMIIYITANYGYPKEGIFLVYMLSGAITVVTSVIVGRLSDSVGKVRMYRIMSVLQIVNLINVTTLVLWHGNLYYLLSVVVFMVISSSRFVPASVLVAGAIPADIRAPFMSVNSSLTHLAFGVSANIAGILAGATHGTDTLQTYYYNGIFATVALLVSIYIVGFLRKEY